MKYAEAGANVVICSRKKDNLDSAVSEAKSSGLNIIGIECNTGDMESIKNVVNQTITLNVNNLQSGHYIVKIINDSGKVTSMKMIKK